VIGVSCRSSAGSEGKIDDKCGVGSKVSFQSGEEVGPIDWSFSGSETGGVVGCMGRGDLSSFRLPHFHRRLASGLGEMMDTGPFFASSSTGRGRARRDSITGSGVMSGFTGDGLLVDASECD
jgi:hypothetical protein